MTEKVALEPDDLIDALYFPAAANNHCGGISVKPFCVIPLTLYSILFF
jgi:hypothetical protein